mmetsp:Transcript_92638/g.244510  ORF Transcript_92638/g.244510 Transcript_92638/m.244510 type:complete len:222 (+) Transcript_92638:277-942(+)
MVHEGPGGDPDASTVGIGGIGLPGLPALRLDLRILPVPRECGELRLCGRSRRLGRRLGRFLDDGPLLRRRATGPSRLRRRPRRTCRWARRPGRASRWPRRPGRPNRWARRPGRPGRRAWRPSGSGGRPGGGAEREELRAGGGSCGRLLGAAARAAAAAEQGADRLVHLLLLGGVGVLLHLLLPLLPDSLRSVMVGFELVNLLLLAAHSRIGVVLEFSSFLQ